MKKILGILLLTGCLAVAALGVLLHLSPDESNSQRLRKKAESVEINDHQPEYHVQETLTGTKESHGTFSWRYGYDINIKNNTIFITANLNFVPSSQISVPQLSRVKKEWEKGIESLWSNRFAVELPSGKQFPILVDVVFRGPDFHHDIVVRKKSGVCNVLYWNMTATPMTAAHEFGHLLGVYDEYEGGAVSPDDPVIDSSSIMTTMPEKGNVYARHYQDILNWFRKTTLNPDARLEEIRQIDIGMISKSDEERI